MNSSEKNEKNVPYNSEANVPGTSIYQNKQYLLSIINATNLNSNGNKIMNIMNSLNLNNMNKTKFSNSFLNKVIINQPPKYKESPSQSDAVTNGSDIDNIFLKQIQNKQMTENFVNNDNNINNNDNVNNKQEMIITEKTKKINSTMESHYLINSLLKNQLRNTLNSNKIKTINNTSELSFSSSLDNNQLNYNTNQNDSFSKNLYLKHLNNKNREMNPLYNNNIDKSNDFSYENKNNIFLGYIKDRNNDRLISQYNCCSNNMSNNKNKKTSNSPLRMAAVFMLKKHHTLNPCDKNIIGKKNDKMDYVESIAFNNKNMKKIIFIKNNDSEVKNKNDESKNEDEIKIKKQEINEMNNEIKSKKPKKRKKMKKKKLK